MFISQNIFEEQDDEDPPIPYSNAKENLKRMCYILCVVILLITIDGGFIILTKNTAPNVAFVPTNKTTVQLLNGIRTVLGAGWGQHVFSISDKERAAIENISQVQNISLP
jgi:hypothetical protein